MQFTREELALIQTALHVQDGCLKSERGMGGDASGVISNTITKVAALRDRIQSYLLRDSSRPLRITFKTPDAVDEAIKERIGTLADIENADDRQRQCQRVRLEVRLKVD